MNFDTFRSAVAAQFARMQSYPMFRVSIDKDLSDVVSFVNPSSDKGSNELLLKFEIVKHIINVRVRERDEQQAVADRREKKQRILELIAQKQDAALAEKSEEELRALAESL